MSFVDREGPVAKVRYTGFTPKEEKPDLVGVLRTRKAETKQCISPSGHSYRFRQRGGANSEWITINAEDAEAGDFTHFERADNFEVQRL